MSALAKEYLQTSHEIARAGHATIVICGQDGPLVVTLDENGDPVSQADANCDHCSACFTTSLFDVPPPALFNQASDCPRQNSLEFTDTFAALHSAHALARGPPIVGMV
ncbi:MAG: hypothetical protein ACRBBQ_12020 [Cognatishimia sp.]